MNIKMKNASIDIPNWIILVGALIADSMYANHCRMKSNVELMRVAENQPKKEES